MSLRGLIELTPGIDEHELRRIVRLAALAARRGKVILALNDLPAQTVSRHLDPIAQLNGYDGGGLRYRPLQPMDDTLLDLARRARFVIADSEVFSNALLARGILHLRTREGVGYLRSLLSPEERDAHSPASPSFLASW